VDDKTNSAGTGKKYSPILGLPVDDEPAPRPTATAHPAAAGMQLSVIIPARNEELNLPGCLHSLLAQSDEFFLLGRDWELIVVDDASMDRTRALAMDATAGHDGVRVLEAPALDLRAATRSFTGKTNACWFGAEQSRGAWLLFTDADTLHEPGDLVRALHEAERHSVALLSYSPRQIVHGVAQHTLMPLIFSELATVYPPKEVNDPARRVAAANGQFLLVERETYFAVGGHRAVGKSVLEDVDLAFNIKRSKRGLRLRYAPDALSTRMYRSFGEMLEGLDQEPGAAVSARAGAGGLEAAGHRPAIAAGATVSAAVPGAVAARSDCSAVGKDAGALLQPRRPLALQLRGLRVFRSLRCRSSSGCWCGAG
jgi:hypothetical protein